MLAEILRRTIEEQADMEAVTVDGSRLTTIDWAAIDVIVAAYDDQKTAVRLLRELPGVRVFALSAHGRESLLYELRPHRVSLGELSPGELIDHIRAGRTDDETVLQDMR